jgi:hypothetical protein
MRVHGLVQTDHGGSMQRWTNRRQR